MGLLTDTTTFDVLRFLVVLEGGVVLGQSAFLLRLYRYARRLAIAQSAATGEPIAGATPYHVTAIALSHCLLVLSAMAWIIGHLGESWAWYGTPLSGIAFAVSIYGLVVILRYENTRASRYLRPYKNVDRPAR